MYIKRELERKFLEMNSFFKAVLVTGARQVGKSTMLTELAREHNRTVVSMDDDVIRDLAQTDARMFFQIYKPPILIDEIQKAPQLFEQIKIICDNTEERGLFWLSGSQREKLMEHARDSLAGRLGILHLYGLSQREKAGVLNPAALDFSLASLQRRKQNLPDNNVKTVFEHIWRGGLPDLFHAGSEQLRTYFQSYIDNYLVADAVNDSGIRDIPSFKKFIKACAAITGNLLNYNTLADAAGISVPTARHWLSVLQDMDVVYLLEPYSNNKLQRLIKAPKLYFCDTGLCAFLCNWFTPESLLGGAAAGHYYENYVVMELLKNYSYAEQPATISYYRDTNAKEIDLFAEENGKIHPLEIKLSASPDKRTLKKFAFLSNLPLGRGYGGIICMYPEPFPVNSTDNLIPSNLI